MSILLGNLRTFNRLGDEEKMNELEAKLKEMGYENEDNCQRNEDTSRLTWHIYDIPRAVYFSFLTNEALSLLKEYSQHFTGRCGISAFKQE